MSQFLSELHSEYLDTIHSELFTQVVLRAVKFCFKLDKTVSETHEGIKIIY